MYDFYSRVRYSEVNADRVMPLYNIMNYFQDCSMFHSETIGLGIDYLNERNQGWVLSSWQTVVERYPRLGEEIRICTWPHEFKGFIGARNFLLESKEGERLAYANSLWIFVDTKSGRPIKVTEDQMEGYALEEPYPMHYAPRKIKLNAEAEGEPLAPVLIQQRYMDSNGHMNNEQYIKLAQDYLPADFIIKEMRAEYRKEVRNVTQIMPVLYKLSDGYAVEWCDAEGRSYAVVQFFDRICEE